MEFLTQIGQGLQDLRNFSARTALGADYIDAPEKRDPRTTKQKLGEAKLRGERRLQPYRVGQEMPPGTRMRGSEGRVPSVRSQYTPATLRPTAPSAGTVNASPIASPINPVPRAPIPPQVKPPSVYSPKAGMRGGILGSLVHIAAESLVEPAVTEAMRGARMIAGDPNYNSPVWLKSVNGTNYDIRTSGGKDAYWKAKNAASAAPSTNSGAGVTPEQRTELATKNQERIARIKAESDATVAAGRSNPDSVFYQAPSAPSAPPAPSGRDTDAPVDPNGAGGKGTSMSYSSFMDGIGTKQNVNVRDPFSSENLPGTAGYGTSFFLNSGENQQSFGESLAASQMVDGRIVPKVTINAAESGRMANLLENQRQLTPGEGSFPTNAPDLGIRDTSVSESKGSKNSAENARLRARAALLGDGNVMDNMRRAEGEMGLISQGSKKFARDTGAESGLREISQDAYRARMGGGNMTQAINDNPIASAAKSKAGARLNASGAGSTAATEAPSDVENPAVIGEDNKVEIIDRSDKMHGARTNFTVPQDKMPKQNASKAVWDKHFADLDAGKLTR